jgi:general nucleoside transport system ATP-binding protein
VEGNGQTELLEAIAGLRACRAGSHHPRWVRDDDGLRCASAPIAGLSHIPEDRHRRGLVLDYSIADNLILGAASLRRARARSRSVARIARHAAEQVQRFDIRPPWPTLPARALSGGNQQKIVIAREMGREFAVLLASQPTRGVDVGAIEFIHEQLRAARTPARAFCW